MVDMGGMTLENYAYLVGLLGIICGLVLVLGMKQ